MGIAQSSLRQRVSVHASHGVIYPVWPKYSNGGNPYFMGRSSLPERRAGATGSTAASATSSISQSQRENRRIRVAGLNTWACDHAAS